MKTTPIDPFEVEAARVITEWMGARGKAVPVGGHFEDFRLEYADGRVGIGEVKRITGESHQKMWQALLAMSPAQSLPLTDGLGTWAVSISVETPLKGLATKLEEIAVALMAEGIHDAQILSEWPRGEAYDQLRKLRISRIWQQTDTGAGIAWLFHEGVGGQLPLSAEALNPWIESYLDQEKSSLRNSLARLHGSAAEERHLFLWAEDGLPDGLRLFLSYHPDRPPQGTPKVPDFLTHLWVGVVDSFTDERWIWLHRRGNDWIAWSTSR